MAENTEGQEQQVSPLEPDSKTAGRRKQSVNDTAASPATLKELTGRHQKPDTHRVPLEAEPWPAAWHRIHPATCKPGVPRAWPSATNHRGQTIPVLS